MKKVILSLLTLVACLTLQAAEVNQQQAMAKAKAFLSQRSGSHRAAANTTLQSATTGFRQLHAFNMEGGGYVIVSASDRTKDILAYAPQGTLDGPIPPAMEKLLKSYAAQIKDAEQDDGDAQDNTPSVFPVRYEIAPLIKQKWAQEYPYNNQTPMVKDPEGKQIHGYTGCVATAMAMVMKYYQWPKAQTPTLPATRQTPELPPVTFNWAAMTDTYSDESPKEACDAVATLMQYCGAAVQMDYFGTASSSDSFKMALGLIRFFGYNSDSIEVTRRTFVTEWEWQNMIYYELSKKRPVICGGDGHQFIIDGYQFGDFYHINWGWADNRDGFFQISAYANGKKKTLPHFPYDIATGVIPTDKPYSQVETLFTAGFLLSKDTPLQLQRTGDTDFPAVKVDMVLKNQSKQTKDNTYDVGLALYQDNKLLKVVEAAKGKLVKHDKYLENVQASITFGQGLADGHYKLYPVSRVQGAEKWEQNEDVNDNLVDVEINGQQMTLTPHPRDFRLKVNSIKYSGDLREGCNVTAVMNITNGSAFDYDGVIALGESKDGTMVSAEALGESYASIPAGKTVDVVIRFIAGEPKTYQTYLYYENFILGDPVPLVISNYEGTIYQNSIELEKSVKLKNVSKEETRTDGNKVYDITGRELDLTLTLRNPDASNAYKGNISLTIFQEESVGDNQAYNTINEQTKKDVAIAPGASTDVKFSYDKFELSNTYTIWIRYEYKGSVNNDPKPLYSYIHVKPGVNVFKKDRTMTSFAPQDDFTTPEDALAVELNGTNIKNLKPNSNPNCLYFLNDTDAKPASLEGRNVVVLANDEYTAENIKLTDGYDFMTPRWFTAKQIEYKRTFTDSERNTLTTLLLPFTAQKCEAGGEAFTLEKMLLAADQAGKVYFSDTPEMIAGGTPAIVRLKADKALTNPVTFSASNASVCDSIFMQTAGRYNMTGTFTKATYSDGETFAFADGHGGSVAPKATSCSPFRACFQAIGLPTGFETLTIDTTTYNTTAIDALRHEASDDAQPYYNLSGQRVLYPRRGIYLHGGRVVIK